MPSRARPCSRRHPQSTARLSCVNEQVEKRNHQHGKIPEHMRPRRRLPPDLRRILGLICVMICLR
jgi:hypothetical protein